MKTPNGTHKKIKRETTEYEDEWDVIKHHKEANPEVKVKYKSICIRHVRSYPEETKVYPDRNYFEGQDGLGYYSNTQGSTSIQPCHLCWEVKFFRHSVLIILNKKMVFLV